MEEDWKVYNPKWIVDLAEEQLTSDSELIEAISKCTMGWGKSKNYVYFVSPKNPNQPNSEWQFLKSIHLAGGKHRSIILDVLKDGRIGGVEFL